MRLLVAMPGLRAAEEIRTRLYARWEGWEIDLCSYASDALHLLRGEPFDILVLHSRLAGEGGREVLRQLTSWQLPCPPRVLYLCEAEERGGLRADCFAHPAAGGEQLCRLVEILAKKPLPALAMQHRQRLQETIDSFLDELSMPRSLKGRHYAAWLLCQLAPSPMGEEKPVSQWYGECATAHRTSAAAVERCLRVAVESVFTQGSMQGIERCFGATVDPEKGKPTNRVFLIKAARLLRRRMADYSFAETRSLNNSEMHHRPAAPTSV